MKTKVSLRAKRSNLVLKIASSAFGLLAMTIGWSTLVLACPGCGWAMPKRLADGFYLSYLLFIAAPLIYVSVIATLLVRSARRARK